MNIRKLFCPGNTPRILLFLFFFVVSAITTIACGYTEKNATGNVLLLFLLLLLAHRNTLTSITALLFLFCCALYAPAGMTYGKINNSFIVALLQTTADEAAEFTGAAAGFAVYSGVMAFAAASTGTPIAALSGAAAYNATMAAIGGGSLAAGGMGMAGGAMVLGTAVAAPLIAIAGWAYDRHATKALENAHQCACDVARAVKKMNLAREHFAKVNQYVDEILAALNRMHAVFIKHYFEPLKSMHSVITEQQDISVSDEVIVLIDHGYSLAAIMTDIITTPLFKPRKQENGEAVIKDNVIEMETDDNGMNVINKDELDDVLASSVVKFDDFSSQS
ncbi:TPA: chemotaxis protein [Escherichia coli]